jgi:cytochrome b involved in lipid metabolism
MPSRKIPYIVGFSTLLLLCTILAIIYIGNKKTETTTLPDGIQKEISLSEILKHSTADDCWVYIGGQVFNASSVIEKNSTYATLLSSVCGGDGTKVYTVQKYSEQSIPQATIVALRDELGTFQIGLLSP